MGFAGNSLEYSTDKGSPMHSRLVTKSDNFDHVQEGVVSSGNSLDYSKEDGLPLRDHFGRLIWLS